MDLGESGALHAVSSAVLAVNRHLSVREVLQVIVRAAAELIDAPYAALGIPDEDGAFAEFVTEGIPPERERAIGPMPRQHGMLAVMLKDGEVHRHGDIRKEPGFWGWPAAHPVMKGFLGVPIRDGDTTLGILFVASEEGVGFSDRAEELLTLFAAHAAIALSNARLHEANRELSVVEERNRLARELHDAVSQKLFSLRLLARAGLSGNPVGALTQVEQLAGEALGELRTAIYALTDLPGDGLADRLRKHCEVLDHVYPAAVTFTAEGAPDDDQAVYRIAQEALHNALRHAEAHNVSVTLTDRLLEIRDDGRGFSDAGSGLGLASMRERARLAGGELSVRSGGEGTIVRLELP
ncbi:GAF domain-containing sensor histidine kinase [Actinocorallia longicatena]|uniref:Oxygen sensor histidine kinase NreB n=1 Tax=Actinocorallia longicatena TaxID=111803 RepID=A0ABP6QDD8_9ACTN